MIFQKLLKYISFYKIFFQYNKLCVLNTGEILGDEEVINNTPFNISVTCVSNRGSLFFLSKKVKLSNFVL